MAKVCWEGNPIDSDQLIKKLNREDKIRNSIPDSVDEDFVRMTLLFRDFLEDEKTLPKLQRMIPSLKKDVLQYFQYIRERLDCLLQGIEEG